MKEQPNPSCYGKPGHNAARCAGCAFKQSCSYFAATANLVESRSHLASYEEIQYWLPEAADFDHIPGEAEEVRERENRNQLIAMLSRFFRFLLDLDDYTIGIIGELVSPSSGNGSVCTVSALGRLHGCSRQAMHRKILDTIARRPELAVLLKKTMYKLSRGRQSFLRRRSVEAIAKGC